MHLTKDASSQNWITSPAPVLVRRVWRKTTSACPWNKHCPTRTRPLRLRALPPDHGDRSKQARGQERRVCLARLHIHKCEFGGSRSLVANQSIHPRVDHVDRDLV